MIQIRLETADGKPVDLNQIIPDAGWTHPPDPKWPQLVVFRGRYFIRVLDVKPPTYREAKSVYVIEA